MVGSRNLKQNKEEESSSKEGTKLKENLNIIWVLLLSQSYQHGYHPLQGLQRNSKANKQNLGPVSPTKTVQLLIQCVQSLASVSVSATSQGMRSAGVEEKKLVVLEKEMEVVVSKLATQTKKGPVCPKQIVQLLIQCVRSLASVSASATSLGMRSAGVKENWSVAVTKEMEENTKVQKIQMKIKKWKVKLLKKMKTEQQTLQAKEPVNQKQIVQPQILCVQNLVFVSACATSQGIRSAGEEERWFVVMKKEIKGEQGRKKKEERTRKEMKQEEKTDQKPKMEPVRKMKLERKLQQKL